MVLIAFGLLLARFPAAAQDPPPKKWDISKVDVSKLPPASEQKDVTFEKDIMPLFKASCVRCHNNQGNRKARGGLVLANLEGVLKGGKDGKMVIPGDSKNSLLVSAAADIDPAIEMPPKPRARRGPPPGGNGEQPPSQPGGPAGAPGGPGRGGPAPKPLTAAQVGLIRAWIDQGAK